jgi:excisionase family DNA binding protein
MTKSRFVADQLAYLRTESAGAIENILKLDDTVSNEDIEHILKVCKDPVGFRELYEQQNPEDQFFRRQEAAEYLGISTRKLDELKKYGEIPFICKGRRWTGYRKSDLDVYMDKDRIS